MEEQTDSKLVAKNLNIFLFVQVEPGISSDSAYHLARALESAYASVGRRVTAPQLHRADSTATSSGLMVPWKDPACALVEIIVAADNPPLVKVVLPSNADPLAQRKFVYYYCAREEDSDCAFLNEPPFLGYDLLPAVTIPYSQKDLVDRSDDETGFVGSQTLHLFRDFEQGNLIHNQIA